MPGDHVAAAVLAAGAALMRVRLLHVAQLPPPCTLDSVLLPLSTGSGFELGVSSSSSYHFTWLMENRKTDRVWQRQVLGKSTRQLQPAVAWATYDVLALWSPLSHAPHSPSALDCQGAAATGDQPLIVHVGTSDGACPLTTGDFIEAARVHFTARPPPVSFAMGRKPVWFAKSYAPAGSAQYTLRAAAAAAKFWTLVRALEVTGRTALARKLDAGCRVRQAGPWARAARAWLRRLLAPVLLARAHSARARVWSSCCVHSRPRTCPHAWLLVRLADTARRARA